jgi:adenylate cyclase
MRPRSLPVLIAVLLAGLWGAALGYVHLEGGTWFLDRVEATMTDLRLLARGTRAAPDGIIIVAVDDDTASLVGGYPLPRATLAHIVDQLVRLRPKVVAVDLLLVDPGPAQGDSELARALKSTSAVIAAAAVFPESRQATPSDGPLAYVPTASRFLLPLPAFSAVATVGVVNVTTDQTGTPRLVPMFFRAGDRIEISFPLRVAAVATGVEPAIEPGRIALGERIVRTDRGYELPLAFYGPRGTIPTVSAADVLSGRLGGDLVENRIVVIGATVTGGGDVFPTPFDPVLPGVEVVSTAISHLMNGDGLIRDRVTRKADAGMAIALPVILVGLLAWRRNLAGLAAAVTVLVLMVVVNVLIFQRGIWLSLALPTAAAGLPVILFGAGQLWLGRRRAMHFASQSAMLQQIQAAGLAQWLARDKYFLMEPVRQDAAVVFVDLSGFTGLSETLGPSATRELLNAFYDLVAQESAACGGVVTSFLGDGAMLLFGLPAPDASDGTNAARCCVRLCRRTRTWIDTLPAATAARLGFKIGAHFGVVVASRLGQGDNQQIAATGDTVNIANRLMEVAAKERAPVAVSDALLTAAGREPFAAGTLAGPVNTILRGRAGSITAWLWREVAAEAG